MHNAAISCNVRCLSTLCHELFPMDVSVKRCNESDHSRLPAGYAVYRDDNNNIAAVCRAGIEFVCFSAGGIAMVPPCVCKEVIQTKKLSDALQDNAAEVMNILATLISTHDGHRVFLEHFFPPGEVPSRETIRFMNDAIRSRSLKVHFHDYGDSVITFYG